MLRAASSLTSAQPSWLGAATVALRHAREATAPGSLMSAARLWLWPCIAALQCLCQHARRHLRAPPGLPPQRSTHVCG